MIPAVIGLVLAAAATAAPPPDTGDVDALVAHALAHHPALAAAASARDEAVAGMARAGSPPDPVLKWGEMLAPVETRVGPQQRVLSLEQMLPWPGTLGTRRDAADARRAAAAAGENAVAVRVAADVRRAWARAAWLRDSRRIVTQQLTLLRTLASSVRAGYEAGGASYGDLLQVQVEVARMEDRRRGLDDEITAATARLNAALGRDPQARLDGPSGLGRPAPGAPAASTRPHPRLVALADRARAAALEADAARQAGRPSVTLGIDWIQIGEARADGVPGSGDDALVARLGLSLPLWRGKHDGAVAAAEARARGAAAERRAQDLDLRARRTATTLAWRDAARRVALHEDDLLPRARQAYEVVLAAYRAEGSDLAAVLDAQRTLLDLENALVTARRDLVLALADHHEAAGITGAPEPTSNEE